MSDSVKKYYELNDQGGSYTVPKKGGAPISIGKTKADVMSEISLYCRLNYQDDWYLQEKLNQLKERIYE